MPDDPDTFLPPQPPIGERELGRLARAALAMRRDTEAAAERGEGEARDVLAYEAQQALARWAPPPSRRRRPPPPGISPQGLSRLEAAAFVGIGTTTFDSMVRDGRLPQPRRFGRRAIWDRDTLAAALGGAAAPAANGVEPNPWDNLLEGRS